MTTTSILAIAILAIAAVSIVTRVYFERKLLHYTQEKLAELDVKLNRERSKYDSLMRALTDAIRELSTQEELDEMMRKDFDKFFANTTSEEAAEALGEFVKNNVKSDANYKEGYVYLLGRHWAATNLTDDTHGRLFSQEEAIRIADRQGMELPSPELFKKLFDLPSVWDDARKGRWFAEEAYLLHNERYSIFLPAAGRYDINYDACLGYEKEGYYWTSNQEGYSDCEKSAFFNKHVLSKNRYSRKPCKFPVRCILPNNPQQ